MKRFFFSLIAAIGRYCAPENKTRNRHHTRQRNSTEITNHNAAIDAAKAEKKAAKRNRRHRLEDAAELARQVRIDEISTPRKLVRLDHEQP